MFTFLFWVYLLTPENKEDHSNIISFGLLFDALAFVLTVAAVLIFKHGTV